MVTVSGLDFDPDNQTLEMNVDVVPSDRVHGTVELYEVAIRRRLSDCLECEETMSFFVREGGWYRPEGRGRIEGRGRKGGREERGKREEGREGGREEKGKREEGREGGKRGEGGRMEEGVREEGRGREVGRLFYQSQKGYNYCGQWIKNVRIL